MTAAPAPAPSTLPDRVRRVAVLSVHTSPLTQPGQGDGGGLNVSVDELSRRLADRGVHVDVFTRATDPAAPPAVDVHRGADGATYRVHHVTAGPQAPVAKDEQANLLCAFLLALEAYEGPRPDLLHGHYWLSGWVGRRLAQRWHVPMVQTFHTLGVLKNAHLAPGDVPEPPLRLVAEAAVARAADRVTVLTAGEAALLRRAYDVPASRLSVVPAGVDLSRFPPVPRTPTPPEGDAGPTLLFVGRLQPLKGPDVAVRTLAEVRRHLPTARLRIVGGASGAGAGASPGELRALAAQLGVADAVTLEPPVPQQDLAAVYRSADVLLAPSRSETFGLVALEAQACGLPVVAADVPGLQAVVGAGGTLVGGHDPAAHAAAALAYLRDPGRWSAASAAGVAAAARSSWDHAVDRLATVYDEVVRSAATAAASAATGITADAEVAV